MTVANVVIRQVLLKRGNTATMSAYTGPIGEVTIDTDLDTLRVQDGITAGGTILANQDYVDAAVAGVGGAVDLAPVYANIAATNSNVANLWTNAATQSASITSLTANAATQANSISVLQGNVTQIELDLTATNAQLLANVSYLQGEIDAANVAIAALGVGVDSAAIDAINANVAAANLAIADLQSTTGTHTTAIATLTANAGAQSTAIAGLLANAATQSAALDVLTANAAYQADWFAGLNSNAAIQDAAIAGLVANAAVQDSAISSLRTDLNANVSTFSGQISTHTAAINTLTANAATQAQLLYLLDANAATQNDYLSGLLANAAAQASDIVTLYANAAAQTSELNVLTANAATQNAALNVLTANAASQSVTLTALAANLSTATSNIADLTANAAYQADWLTSLTSNAGVQSDALTVLTANAATQAATLVTLTANAAAQSSALDVITANLITLTANAATQNAALNVLTANAAYQSDYLDGLLANAATQAGTLITLTGNAATQAGLINAINANVVGANAAIAALQSSVGTNSANIATLFSNAATQNAALNVLTANAAYQADWLTSLTATTAANAATQSAQIDLINSNVASLTTTVNGIITGTGFVTETELAANMAIANAAITSATTGNITLSGTLSAANIILSVGNGGVFWANGTRYIPYGNVAVSNYLLGFNGPITSNILTVTTAVKSNVYQFANGVSIFSTISGATLGNLSAVDQQLIGNNSASPILLGDANNSAQLVQSEAQFVANASISSTNHTTGALVIPNGGLGVAGNVYLSGHPDTRFQVGEGGQFLPNVLAQFTSNVDSYVQINMQNLNSSPLASSDFVATADNGNDTQNFIDMGIASSTYNYPGYTAIKPNDGYLITNGGNLLLSAASIDKTINFYAGGTEDANQVGEWSAGNLRVGTHIVPTATGTFSLGSVDNTYANVYATTMLLTGDITFSGSPGGSITGANMITSKDVILGGNIQVANNITTSTLTTTGDITRSYSGGAQGLIQMGDGVNTNYIVSVGSAASTWGGAGSLNMLTYNDTPIVFFQNQVEAGRISSGQVWNISKLKLGATGLTFNDNSVQTTAYGNTQVATYLPTYSGNIAAGNVMITNSAGRLDLPGGAYIWNDPAGGTRLGSVILQPNTAASSFAGVQIGGAGRILAPNQSVHMILNTSDVTVQVALKATVPTAATSTSTGGLVVTGGAGIAGNAFIGGNIVQGSAYYETYSNVTNSGANITCNFVNGGTFYANLSSNVTANFTNVNALTSSVTGATVVVDQGVTPYSITGVQINGVNQTVKWVGATPGVGTASNTDVMSFSFIHLGSGVYRVLGQVSNYG